MSSPITSLFTTSTSNNNNLITGELQIPTSYGHLAAKTWGTDGEDKLKVLAVHGWQDNAGTFNRLFPLLDHLNRMYIVALDLPGHGSSSHLPKGVPYTDMTWVIEMKRTLDYLGWTPSVTPKNKPESSTSSPQKRVTIIAHSMGANASVELAALYPNLVANLIMLDTVKLRIFPTEKLASEMAKAIDLYSEQTRLTELRQFPGAKKGLLFDLEGALNVIMMTHGNGRLDRDAALNLMGRAVQWTGGRDAKRGFEFRRDPRLTVPVYRKFDCPQLLEYLSGIRCRLLIVRAKQTHPTLICPHEGRFIELYEERCEEFTFARVDGDHYVHLTAAHRVAPLVNEFLGPLFEV